jgi:hypothetical protein
MQEIREYWKKKHDVVEPRSWLWSFLITMIKSKENELVPTLVQSGRKVCIDYRKLNSATRKDHFPPPFICQMLERLAGHAYYCFLDGYSS